MPLNRTQAERFRQALAYLRSGLHAQALTIAKLLVDESPRAGDAWQLLGLCQADSGRPLESDIAFERALALAPGNVPISRNYAACLARHGKALRNEGALDMAERVLRKALALSPELASAWVDLAVVLRTSGRIDGALNAFRKAAELLDQRGASSLEVRNAINGVLAEAGFEADALTGARELIALHPDHALAHETLSSLLWEHGADHASDDDPLAMFREAAREQPGNRELQLAFARTLLMTRRAEQALEVLDPLRRREPDDPLLTWYAANALDALRQFKQATSLYAAAARSALGQLPEFLNAHARHAFRIGDIELVTRCAETSVKLDPRNQEGWCQLGTAWRLVGDAREHWLCDYETLVGYVELTPPPGYSDLPDFLQALQATLDTMHRAGREPLDQSVRGGTQTPGQLFGRNDAVIQAAEVALRATVERWLRTLPQDAAHPFLAHAKRSVHFAGSWSVRLKSSGRHSNHIHPKGWASSAFYVALPGVVASGQASPAGWLQFGQPLEDLGLDLPPRRLIQPRPGYLALFPSYLWHGTIPFDAQESRLTIAFDMQPRTSD